MATVEAKPGVTVLARHFPSRERETEAEASVAITERSSLCYWTSLGPLARGVSFSCMMPSRRATSV